MDAMFELPLAYVNQTDRERDVTADLRARQILKAPDASESIRARSSSVPAQRSAGTRVRAVER
jgi:hypothetical protein